MVADPAHDPFFSLESPSLWITHEGFQLFSRRVEVREGAFDVDDLRQSELIKFRRVVRVFLFCIVHTTNLRFEIVPVALIDHTYFSLDNAHEWVRLGALAVWKLWIAPSDSHSSFVTHMRSVSRMSSPYSSHPASPSSYARSLSSPPRTHASAMSSRAASTHRSAPVHGSTLTHDHSSLAPEPSAPLEPEFDVAQVKTETDPVRGGLIHCAYAKLLF